MNVYNTYIEFLQQIEDNRVEDIQRRYEAKITSLNQKICELENEIKTVKQNLGEFHEAKAADLLAEREQAINAATTEASSEKSALRSEMQGIIDNIKSEKAAAEAKISELNSQIEALRKNFADELEKQRQDLVRWYENEESNIKSSHSQEMSKLNNDARIFAENVKVQIQKMKGDHLTEINNLRSQCEQDKQQVKNRLEAEKETLRKEKDAVISSLNKKNADLTAAKSASEKHLREEKATRESDLRKDFEKFKGIAKTEIENRDRSIASLEATIRKLEALLSAQKPQKGIMGIFKK